MDIAKLATEKLVEAIYKEQAFLDLYHKLYHTQDWEDGSATASILATLNDYFHDYERYIDPSNYKRCPPLTSSMLFVLLRLAKVNVIA